MKNLLGLCIRTAEEIKKVNNNLKNLIFPCYKSGKRRISEQEARLVFTQQLEKERKIYGVEVPTKNYYKGFSTGNPSLCCESTKGYRSAIFDLAIFKDRPSDCKSIMNEINIEFKAHNKPQHSIEKDLLKLIADDGNGLFFHLIQSVDNNTLAAGYSRNLVNNPNEKGILTKYRDSLLKISRINNFNTQLEKHMLFFIVSLKPSFYLYKIMNVNNTWQSYPIIDTFFKFSYNKNNISSNNGWTYYTL